MKQKIKENSLVGKSIPRIDAPAKATGKALYTADIILPSMLYGKILRSTVAHAKIINMMCQKL